ncbi:MAG: ribonuclease P protein component [Candidatus Zambryskibacteria bacterium RIFCSPLOWO2_02_FULL_39_26]|nr:MAG: ribonuclease P protein component [Candidatus Zambryskibacteria bacterium RIFCSPHIGHO2_02_39_10]OHA99723.1 MAG: ribonuclease P protein component [Candidatus Zambryskibacteria bacterium RIFCSPHIGHO2_12_FULL_39_47]OHB10163.1 MAG: ribonuclease P protein component [Candidatus Zambryskibacteria bacterium RIFCSPLOWO2_02_FULL_39_26]
MLSKERRIRKNQFPEILKHSKRYNSTNFLLYVMKGLNLDSKFSFSVSKKICKKASGRNKLRRRGYSAITRHIKKIKPGYLCFFSIKNGNLGEKSFTYFEKEIVELLSVSGMLS